MQINKLTQSTEKISEAIKIAEKINSKPLLTDVFLTQAKLDSAKGNFKEAFTMFKKYAYLKDSLFNKRKSEKIAYLLNLYENERQAHEKDKLIVNANAPVQLHYSKTSIWFNITIIILTLCVAVLFYLRLFLIEKLKEKNQ